MKHLYQLLILILIICIQACERIENGDSLNKSTKQFISSLGLLEKDEKIIKFYSNYSKKKAGNFFTDKRIAHYWLEGDNNEKDTSSAFYPDIISIDTVFTVPDTFALHEDQEKRQHRVQCVC